MWPFSFLLHAIRFGISTVPHSYSLAHPFGYCSFFFFYSFINWVLHCRLVMMDLKEWSSPELNESKKCCADCKTTKTPLWRGGPAGPKAQQHSFLFHVFHPSLCYGLNYSLLSFLFCSCRLCATPAELGTGREGVVPGRERRWWCCTGHPLLWRNRGGRCWEKRNRRLCVWWPCPVVFLPFLHLPHSR